MKSEALKTIYHIQTENPEMDIFFDWDNKLIDYWYCNDAQYRHEYMGHLFVTLGYFVESGDPNDKRFKKEVKRLMKENM